MKEYHYTVEISAMKELVVQAESQEEADVIADLVTSSTTIPVRQDDIVELQLYDETEAWDEAEREDV